MTKRDDMEEFLWKGQQRKKMREEVTLIISRADLFLIRKALDAYEPDVSEVIAKVDLLTWLHTDFGDAK